MRELKIFDFDDTLAKSETPVIVKKKDGSTIKLTPGEFATYKADPSDVLDFTYFNKMLKNAAPIKHNVALLKKYLSNPGRYKVTILTARALAFPIKYWIKKLTGEEVYVVAVAGSNPQLKANYIEKEIQKGYTDIFFIDDSLPNVTAIRSLEKKYPEVNINAIVAEQYFLNKINTLTEDLRDWFGTGGKGGVGGGGWDRYNSKGERVGKCGDAKEGDAYAACLSKEKARKLGKKGRAAFVNRKRGAQKKAGDAKKGGEHTKGQKPVKVKTEMYIIKEYTPSNPADINKAIEEIEKLGVLNPINPNEIVIDNSVIIEVSNFDKRLWISSLYSIDSGKGNARRIMEKIMNIADKYKVTVALDPIPFGSKKTKLSKSQLVKFYKSLGFKFQKGESQFGDMERIAERVELFLEKNIPTDPSKWSYYKSQAKKKFDVYPSAYANAWAAKMYKKAGGGWRKEK